MEVMFNVCFLFESILSTLPGFIYSLLSYGFTSRILIILVQFLISVVLYFSELPKTSNLPKSTSLKGAYSVANRLF